MASGKHAKTERIFHAAAEYPSRAVISRSAFEHNLQKVREWAGGAEIMAVVKADAYGHGAVPISRWAIEAGVRWLVIAQLGEAISVRRQLGVNDTDVHILSLISAPESSYCDALELGIDFTVNSLNMLDCIAHQSAQSGMPARVQLEVDTGMARGGVSLSELPSMAQTLADYVEAGLIELTGVWSHLACADDLDSPLTSQQVASFQQAQTVLAEHGLKPPLVHLAASGGLLWHPQTHYTAVRPGIVLYGISPEPAVASARALGLQPVMRVEANIVSVRDVPQGTGVSYGHTAHTFAPTRLATVPLGYADGIPRSASNHAYVRIGERQCPQIGRVCMDQFIMEAPGARVGDTAVLFGGEGAPSADDWAQAAGTIGYEIVSRIGQRVPRYYVE